MPHCQAFGCSNHTGRDQKSFFRIPNPQTHPELCRKWLNALSVMKFDIRTFESSKDLVVCGDHFTEDCFVEDIKSKVMGTKPRKILKDDAVPTVFSFRPTPKPQLSSINRIAASIARQKKMDGKQHLTPTSSNTGQPEGKHYLNDSKGTRTQSHEHLRGQTKDDIQIREGQGLNVLRNSEPGRYSEVMNTSKDKEGQLESKGVVGKPADGAQIVIPQTASGSSAASEQSIQGTGSAPLHPELLSNDANSILQRSVSVDGETQLNQAAIKLLQRLEFKNPGRKQIEYGTFNPEESEREKKKLRRFQTSKPRTGACYKEDGILLDGRDLCDCLTETCPGCFYPCPQCSSPKCGPTCRNNRRWVYDYIEDEGRTYKIEFPEAENLAT